MHVPTGAQLWAMRHIINKNKSAEAVLESIARAGYTFIEPAGFDIETRDIQGFNPNELRQLAANQGLKIVSGHFPFLPDDIHAMCETAAEAGMKYIIIANLPEPYKLNIGGYKKAAEALSEMGDICNNYGLQIGYHNHAHEFEAMDDIIPFDFLLNNTDAENVIFQMDIGWVVHAGQSPINYFNKYPGRFALWHIRDIDAITHKSTAIGKGRISYKEIFLQKETAGLQYAIIEMSSDVEDPLGNLLYSYKSHIRNTR